MTRATVAKMKQQKPKSVVNVRNLERKRKAPKSSRNNGNRAAVSMGAYDSLIRDPCGAPLVHPPYVGTGSGYLCRTVENFTVADTSKTGLVVGTAGTGVVNIAIAPGNYSTSTGYAFCAGSTGTATVFGRSVFPVTSSVVRKFRAVAACLKWVPYGAYAARAGVVGMGYANGGVMSGGDTVNASSFLAAQMESAPNGSKLHEIRWLPTQDDQNWKSSTDGGSPGNGTVTLSLLNVDGIATSATTVTLSGYVEMTIVWEWAPSEIESTAGGLSQAPSPAPGFTVNDHQRTIGNIGTYLLHGVREATHAAGEAFVMGLSRGVGKMTRAQPSMRFLT